MGGEGLKWLFALASLAAAAFPSTARSLEGEMAPFLGQYLEERGEKK